jgi:hypothetical protein
MDWKQFFAALAGSTAWPIAIVVIVLILRNPLAKVILRVKSLKYGELDIDLSEQLNQAEAAVITHAGEALPDPASQPGSVELARIDPKAAVLSAWLQVEKAMQSLSVRAGIQPRGRTPTSVAGELHARGLIDEISLVTLRNVRKIRNEAAHLSEVSISFDEAVTMAGLCQWLAARLDSTSPRSEQSV